VLEKTVAHPEKYDSDSISMLIAAAASMRKLEDPKHEDDTGYDSKNKFPTVD
jgi:hypothetical protein